jgi:hypothetical protein
MIFLEINQSETFHRCFLPSVGSFGQAVSEEKTLVVEKGVLYGHCITLFISSPCQRQRAFAITFRPSSVVR